MFECPETCQERGLEACRYIREACEILRSKGLGTEAESFVKPLDMLLDCYEATLWGAVDFHGIGNLEEHHISSCRTAALLRGAAEEITMPSSEDMVLLREILEEAISAVLQGGRPCRVGNPGEHLGITTAEDWDEKMAEELGMEIPRPPPLN